MTMTTMDTSKDNSVHSALNCSTNVPTSDWTVKRPRNEGNWSTMVDGGRRTSLNRGQTNNNNNVDNNNNNNDVIAGRRPQSAPSSSSSSPTMTVSMMMVPNSGFDNGHNVQWGDDDNASIYSPSPKRMKWSIISQEEEPEEQVDNVVDGRRKMGLFSAAPATNVTSSSTFTAFRMPFSSPSAVSCSSSPDRSGIVAEVNNGVDGNNDDDTQMTAVKLEDGGPNETNTAKNVKDKTPSSSSPLEWWKRPQPKQDEASRQHSVKSGVDQTTSPSSSTGVGSTSVATSGLTGPSSALQLPLLQCHICQQSFPKTPTQSVKNVMKPNALLQYFTYKNHNNANGSNGANEGEIVSTATAKPAPAVSTAAAANDNPDTCHRCSRSCCTDCRSKCLSCQEVVCGFCCIQSNNSSHSDGGGGGGGDYSITMMDCDDDDGVAGGYGQRTGKSRISSSSSSSSTDNEDGMVCWDCASRRH